MEEINLTKGTSLADIDGNKIIRSAFKGIFLNASSEAQLRHKGNGVFDFTESEGAKALQERLKQHLAVGNNAKDAKVTALLFDVVNASITLDVELFHRYRLTKDEILKALNAALKVHELPFEHAKKACKFIAKSCKSFIAKAAAYPVCYLAKSPPKELDPPPPVIQSILSGTNGADTTGISNGNAEFKPANGPVSPVEVSESRLPLWCYLKDAHHAFEVTLDANIRGLTIDFDGTARVKKSGDIIFEAMRYADFGQLLLGHKEKVRGVIQLDGDLVVTDHDEHKVVGRCRSVL